MSNDTVTNEAAWRSSTRGRQELRLCALIMAAFFVVPLVVKELFPFSAATMFAYKLDQMATYDVSDDQGLQLENRVFGLEPGPNRFDPPVDTLARNGYGRKPPDSAYHPGTASPPASEEEVTRLVSKRLTYFPRINYVVVRQTIYGALDSKSVGIVRQSIWKIEKPE